VNTFRQKVFL